MVHYGLQWAIIIPGFHTAHKMGTKTYILIKWPPNINVGAQNRHKRHKAWPYGPQIKNKQTWAIFLSLLMLSKLLSQVTGAIWQLVLTHWCRTMHICVGKLTTIGSDNGLSPGRRQTIIWTNAGILLIGPLGTNVSEILIECHSFSFKKMHIKMSSGKWRPSCLGLNVLNICKTL